MLITTSDDRDLEVLCFSIARARPSAMMRVDSIVLLHDRSCVGLGQRHTWAL